MAHESWDQTGIKAVVGSSISHFYLDLKTQQLSISFWFMMMTMLKTTLLLIAAGLHLAACVSITLWMNHVELFSSITWTVRQSESAPVAASIVSFSGITIQSCLDGTTSDVGCIASSFSWFPSCWKAFFYPKSVFINQGQHLTSDLFIRLHALHAFFLNFAEFWSLYWHHRPAIKRNNWSGKANQCEWRIIQLSEFNCLQRGCPLCQ